MDHEKKDEDYKMDDIILPGFRFHPTDEELVGFYLIRKIQQRPLSIELIKQADIYKYDPWDLPKLASNGEKEWYFYCPRDRKYRNSARPNRVTRVGFWKATGTDRPIYTSDGTKCIGLKKSLVFYRGKAAKGIKTDWMMHEFRLPSLSDSMPPPKKLFLVKKIPANDAWAICKIFKKATTMAQRVFNQNGFPAHFNPENISTCTNKIAGAAIQSSSNGFNINFHDLETPSSYQPIDPTTTDFDQQNEDLSSCFTFSPNEMLGFTAKNALDVTSLLNKNFDQHNINAFEGAGEEQSMDNYYSMSFSQDIEGNAWEGECLRKSTSTSTNTDNHHLVNNVRSIRFPFSLAPSEQPDVWKPKLSW